MSDGFNVTLHLSSPDETGRLAALIAPGLRAGDVVLLVGEIGAGKTHFARSVIQTRLADKGKSEDIPSPTYTLVQTYSDGLTDIWHADLYRLTDIQEIHELGLEDAFKDAICFVEWPDRLGVLRPKSALTIDFATNDSAEDRILTLSTKSDRWVLIQSLLSGFVTKGLAHA